MKKLLILIALLIGLVAQAEVKPLSGKEFVERYNTLGVEIKKPAIVDFNADWCGPCKRLAPILEELSNEYGDRVDFFSVNVDDNRDVVQELGIESIPYIVFVSTDDVPQALTGFYEKDMLEGIMLEYLLGEKSDKVNLKINEK